MIKKNSARLVVKAAKLAAVYAHSKASAWTHYQAKEPKMK